MREPTAVYDIIFIGAGHNSLTCASYLAKGGLSVMVLEKRLDPGGGMNTEHVHDGFYHNLHSVFHVSADEVPPPMDLELEKFGCRYVIPYVNHAQLLKDGKSLVAYSDKNKTAESIAKFSSDDAKRYIELQKFYDMMLADNYSPPMEENERKERFASKWRGSGEQYVEITSKSPYALVTEFFEDDIVRSIFMFNSAAQRVKSTHNGVSFMTIKHILRLGRWGMPRGGSAAPAKAMVALIHRYGGLVQTGAEVDRIVVKDGKAQGVSLSDGRYFEARRAVVSGTNHVHTLLKMVGEEYLDRELIRKIREWKWHEWTIFGAHLSLNEPPKYKAASRNPEVNNCFHPVFGYDKPSDLLRHYDILSEGKLPDDPSGEAWCLTLFDPTQAPAGKHVAGFWQFIPYDLRQGGSAAWDDIKDEYLDVCIKRWREYAPNLDSSNIIRKFAYSPLNTEREIISMVHGDAHHGDYVQQVGMNRPCPELAHYRTPIRNLYLCGSSSHPGGSITYAPGYNAANTIAEDLGLKRWWPKPEFLRGFAWENW